MQRIGIAASKMSKGSLLNYNLCVILIATLFSLLIFLICGFFIFLIVFLASFILHAVKPAGVHGGWVHMLKIALSVLALVVGAFDIIAIAKNLQLTKKKL